VREAANANLPASIDTMHGASSLSSVDTMLKQAISKSFRTLDPVAMSEPPANGPLQWRDLIPAAQRLAAAVGLAALAAFLFVFMMPASDNQAQNSNASSVVEAPKIASDKIASDKTASDVPASEQTASDAPKASPEKPAARDEEATPALAEFATILAAGPAAQPAGPAMTHEQSEALLQQFVRWQQKFDSTGRSPQ
jgi:hypothetical protein